MVVVDVGVAADFAPSDGLYLKKVARGTPQHGPGAGHDQEEALAAIQAGMEVVETGGREGPGSRRHRGDGHRQHHGLLSHRGCPHRPARGAGCGPGHGRGRRGLQRKISVIERAIALNRPDPNDPLDVLAKVGGLEIAGLVGVVLAGAARRLPVVVDGFISGAAALVAARFCPAVRPYLIASHRSVEVGHRACWSPGAEAALRPGHEAGGGHRRGDGHAADRRRPGDPRRDGNLRRGRGEREGLAGGVLARVDRRAFTFSVAADLFWAILLTFRTASYSRMAASTCPKRS